MQEPRETWVPSLCLEAPPGEANGDWLQYSCLENPTDKGAWQATVHRVSNSQTRLKWLSTHACTSRSNLAYVCQGLEFVKGIRLWAWRAQKVKGGVPLYPGFWASRVRFNETETLWPRSWHCASGSPGFSQASWGLRLPAAELGNALLSGRAMSGGEGLFLSNQILSCEAEAIDKGDFAPFCIC